jgi:hypothetical protein
MNINRNVLKIVAGVLLAASLPAGAQVLGGSIGGAANGALGGGLGQGVHGTGGIMGGGSITGPDVAGTAGKVRERAQQAGERTKDAASNTAGALHSRVEGTRGAASATAQGSAAAGATAAQGTAGTATQSGNATANGAASSATAPQGGVLFDGASSAGMEKQALGRDVSVSGSGASSGRADRSGINASSGGQAEASAKKSPSAQ